MQPPPYSRLQHERRFLVAPDRLEFLRDLTFSRGFEDRYLRCGRLRLRAMTNSDDGETTYKLTKKYPRERPELRPIVSVWLTADEYTALRALPGDDLIKTRWYLGPLHIDVFAGPLTGLVVCEAEADAGEVLRDLVLPPWIGVEITDDPFFAGGHLVTADPATVLARLAAREA